MFMIKSLPLWNLICRGWKGKAWQNRECISIPETSKAVTNSDVPLTVGITPRHQNIIIAFLVTWVSADGHTENLL